MYGQSPGRPANLAFEIFDNNINALNHIAIRRQVRVFFDGKMGAHFLDLLIYYPKDISRKVPIFVGLNFAGNQSIANDTAIKITTSWVSPKTKGVIGNHATELTRGIAAAGWPIEIILNRGYALATIYAGDVDPDFDDEFNNGIHSLYPDFQKRNDNFSTMGAWAWGLSRAMDYFETDPAIDAKKVIVVGTSRMGKAAIWAGATDQRFAMVISNESGAGGAKLFHHLGGEDTKNLCTRFPYWFCKNFQKYKGLDTSLPFDQHMLIALIAPRPVYIASASGSSLTDSYGEFLSAKYADPVYRLFHTKGLPVKEMPQVDIAIFGQIGYHNRSGKHDILPYDWEQFLRFADMHFRRNKKNTFL